MAVPHLEIRLLKARTRAAEDCLRFVLMKQPRIDDAPVEYGSWWLPPLQMMPAPFQTFPLGKPSTSLLKFVQKKKAGKKVHQLDKKLAQLEALAPVEVLAVNKIKDYYKDLGQIVPRPLKTIAPPLEPERTIESNEREHMFGYYFCPVKYVRAAGSKLQSLRYKFTNT